MNEGHVLEVISLPEGVSVGFGLGDNFVGIPAEQIFEVFTNNNPGSIIGYRFSYSDLETASIKLPSNVTDGTDDFSFKARVGVLDGNMDSGEPRYGYSRLSDYTISLGTVHGIKDDLIIGTGSSDISAGGGNDTIIPELGSSGSIDGGSEQMLLS